MICVNYYDVKQQSVFILYNIKLSFKLVIKNHLNTIELTEAIKGIELIFRINKGKKFGNI